MNLIMLCGQGSSGKSTLGKILEDILSNSKLISVDKLVKKYNKNKHFSIYINEIILNINKKYDNIILDFSHCEPKFRAEVLDACIDSFKQIKINFITISLRPGYEKIIKWHEKRCSRILNNEEKDNIINIYQNFIYPTMEEFDKYNFNTVTNITIDNSKITLI